MDNDSENEASQLSFFICSASPFLIEVVHIAHQSASNSALRPEEEMACQLFVGGLNRAEAMRGAGYSEVTIAKKGAYIFGRERVKRRIQELQAVKEEDDDLEDSVDSIPVVSAKMGLAAIEILQSLMTTAESESVRLQAATQILRLAKSQPSGATDKVRSVSTREIHDKLRTAE